MGKLFAAIYEQGSNWIPGKPIQEQPLADHVNYLTGLHKKNVVSMGGPFADGGAGLVILEAADLVEASRLVDNDPAIRSGVLKARIRQWNRIV